MTPLIHKGKKPKCHVRKRNRKPNSSGTAKAIQAVEAIIDSGIGIIRLHGITATDKCSCGKPNCKSPGKHPDARFAPNGINSPPMTLRELRNALRQDPHCNLAVVTGGEFRLFVLDVDERHGGIESLQKLIDEHGDLPVTVSHRTGGGGYHLWFYVPAGLELTDLKKSLGPGLDIKCAGGMANIPPSRHASGNRYEWQEGCSPAVCKVATMPPWMVELLTSHKTSQLDTKPWNWVSDIPEGKRNEVLTQIAGFLRSLDFDRPFIQKALIELNKTCCTKPLPDEEVASIAKSISRYKAGKAACVPRRTALPLDVFPKPLKAFITQAAASMGCEPDMIAAPILAVAASAIGNTRTIQIKESWHEPAVLWIVVHSESGSMKSPAIELAVAPAVDHEAFYDQKYEAELAAWKALTEDKQKKVPIPIKQRCLVGDVTVEAVAHLLTGTGGGSRGLLLWRDELSGWAGGFNQYKSGGNTDEAFWLSAYGARPHTVDRKTGERPHSRVERAAASVCGGIQPGIMERVMSETHRESGLAARIFLSIPPRRQKRWTDNDLPDSARDEYSRRMRRLYTLKPNLKDGKPIAMRMSTPAKERCWIQFFNEHNQEGLAYQGDLAAAWSKLEGGAARFALVLEHLHWAFSDEKEPPIEVRLRSVRGGVRLARWFSEEAKRFYCALEASKSDVRTSEVLAYIRRKWGHKPFTARDLSRANTKFAQDTEELLDALVQMGAGKWRDVKSTKRGGRPTRQFQLLKQL